MKKYLTSFVLPSLLLAYTSAAHADDYILTLKDHQFSPPVLTIPANQKVKITVKNLDSTPAEFESHDLKREKVITGKSDAIISVGPLTTGTYHYFDEFHEETAKGTIVVQ